MSGEELGMKKPNSSVAGSGEKGNVFLGQHGNDVNQPAYSKDTDRDDPKKPDYHLPPEYTVDSLHQRIKEKGEDEFNNPVEFINFCSCHIELLI